MKQLIKYLGILLLTGILYNCTDENIFRNAETDLRITGEVSTSSRTEYTVGEEALSVSWTTEDKIGLFTSKQPDALCYQAIAAGKQAEFVAQGNALGKEEKSEVYAYYPYQESSLSYPYAPLPHIFGQNYHNDLLDPACDFMHAKSEILDNAVNFRFTHLFAFLKINIRTELLKDAQGLLVSSNEIISYLDNENSPACYDLQADTLAGEKYNYLWYYIPEEVISQQETVTCYIAILPTSADNKISFFIYDKNNNTDHGLLERNAPEGGFQAGHVYDLSINENEFDKIIAQEREALIALYKAAGGDNWTDNTNWCTDKPLNEWYGVSFWNGHVRGLHLTLNNLVGKIPAEIGNLTALEIIDFDQNQLNGSIPEEIGNLKQLKAIYLSQNQFSGSIPESIGNLSALETISIYNNKLDGTIPESIGNLSALNYLSLSNNALSGPIPESIGNLSALESISLNYNKLNSPIPESIGKLSALKYISFDNNKFNGPIPESIENLSALEYLYLNNNQLSGPIPESIGKLTSLQYLWINDNELTGTLPVSMANLNLLENINLCGNLMSGHIPNEVIASDWWNRLGCEKVIYQRDGNKLTFSMYESSDYSADGTVTTLQQHTIGNGLKIVIMGEAYSDRLIADGTYRKHAEMAMEAFFSEEPYTSFRQYFDVYMVNVVSRNEVIGENTAFETSFEFDRNTFITNPVKAIEIVSNMAETHYQPTNINSIILMNTRAPFRSNCWRYSDDFSAAFCLCNGDFESIQQLIHHESCGHGFGQLADEYTEFEGVFPNPEGIRYEHTRNESMNVDVTDNPQEVVWSYYLTDMRYEKEKIGIYEGAIYYPKGAYRATENSIMRGNTGGFNAPSRQSIYRRIMEKSGGTYRFEDFLEYDETNRQRIAQQGASRAASVQKTPIGLPPVKFDYPSTEAKSRWKKTDAVNIPFRY